MPAGFPPATAADVIRLSTGASSLCSWHVARGTWHVARGTGHVCTSAHGTSHVARRTSHVCTCSRGTCPVARDLAPLHPRRFLSHHPRQPCRHFGDALELAIVDPVAFVVGRVVYGVGA